MEDAIFQMELLSHGFFLFFNMDSNEYNVAYRRQDGDYGVIEPELT
ncbi:MAG: sigma 54 modulation/S30EA ribosomal C-terminal domain-containing protein [SAR202 cluster bacterium]|nr:sigma 54 modulation/S30EA ribosomal C-terminal domain-containing protein [SAR202 cluster bacterium]